MPEPQELTVVLVLQGGGALGAYHVGAYQAMQEAGLEPDWVAGTSIGAFTCGVITGNPPARRVARLRQFWDEISRPDVWGAWLPPPLLPVFNAGAVMETMLFGQPNFFRPNVPGPFLSPQGSTSATAFYDTSPMLETLARLCDFDLINEGPVRISLGATNVRTGDLVYFDNRKRKRRIRPEHILASGSLPPGFPAVDIDGDYYWDGGCVSNTPLQAVLDDPPRGHTLVFVIDLWGAAGDVPQSIDQVIWRQRQIQYASRTGQHIDTAAEHLNLRRNLSLVKEKLPAGALADPAIAEAVALAYDGKTDILHIQYAPGRDQRSASDAEFSRPSIARRIAAGYKDMSLAIRRAPWRTMEHPHNAAVVVHYCSAGTVKRSVPPA